MAMIGSSWERYRSVWTLFLTCTFCTGLECACFISIDKFNLRNRMGIARTVNQTITTT